MKKLNPRLIFKKLKNIKSKPEIIKMKQSVELKNLAILIKINFTGVLWCSEEEAFIV